MSDTMAQISIAKAMYDYTERWPDKEISHISPSMLGGCLRKHYYAIIGIPKTTPPGPGAQLNFELGRMWEEVVEKALQNSSIPHLYQYKMHDAELNILGTLDFLLYDPGSKTWEVVDSKTESTLAGGYRKRENNTFLSANKDYVYQVNTYALTALRQGFDVRKARFVVINKDNGKIDEFPLNITKTSLEVTLRRIKRLNRYLHEDKLPPCECKGWKVGYCNYGNPHSQKKNSSGKIVNTECCSPSLLTEGRFGQDGR